MATLVEGYTALTPDNGVQKRVLVNGNGDLPKDGVLASVHYVGTLYPNGAKFDSSRDRGKPFQFKLGAGKLTCILSLPRSFAAPLRPSGQVIQGWDIGVKTMRPGEKADFILAPKYAYGDRSVSNLIPANSTLRFEALYYLNDVWEEELEEEARQVRVATLSNLAAVLLKEGSYAAAAERCSEALKLEGQHGKTLYRLAQAQFALGDYDAASESTARGLKLLPDDAAFQAMHTRIKRKQAEYDADKKATFARMFANE
ncbi:hypothetical protein SYNPS1DRAFT_26798 [Syncephalis pseudoplumigaleata]|uniref:peptidylprolyl isomerase n=1 Tax=Syncephalis pseudoplumigaleata TaxID=1712513 RepID=A0A4P9Z536_9FUNG|nr:hypothetical protein SYNPS1DRAFT_26798 [Syncephalis pseudoplumigaleata]|eukprot:RKP27548.1 hypothetical protein SYNPS1DRAFT_26798 [Syncephalis pseudoplumigaleata]